MVDSPGNKEKMKPFVKFITYVVIPLIGVIAGVIGTGLGFDIFRTLMLGLATLSCGYIAEMAVLIANHDKAATDHYAVAMERYDKLTDMGEKIIHRALVDVESLIEVIETDMKKLIDHKEQTDRNLLFHLVKLDLETLKVRLVEIHNDGAITLDNHQLKSHRIICEVMEEENIKEYRAIYDARKSAIELDQYDEAFADTLSEMVSADMVKVSGIVVVSDDINDEKLNELIKDLVPYYTKEGYVISYIKNKQFKSCCSSSFTEDKAYNTIFANPDIGVYGDRYVYVGVPVPEGEIQRGRFERKADTVKKYRSLFNCCKKHSFDIPSMKYTTPIASERG